MIASDSQAMGRVGEVVMRTWQTAHKMKVQFGQLADESGAHAAADNFLGVTVCGKIHHQPRVDPWHGRRSGLVDGGKVSGYGAVEAGLFWGEAGVDLERGHDCDGQHGRSQRVHSPTPQPTFYRPMFGAAGKARASTCVTFVSQASLDAGLAEELKVAKRLVAVKGTRTVTKG